VGAPEEGCGGAGINNPQCFPTQSASGAAYIYARSGNTWVVQSYVKASNPGVSDRFGFSISLSADGNTVAVGAVGESSAAPGINGNQADDSLTHAGAAYVFTRTAGTWTQAVYLKASNPVTYSSFGAAIRLNDAGTRLAASAPNAPNTGLGNGAVYVFDRTGSVWAQQALLPATNGPTFIVTAGYGISLAFDAAGDSLIVGNELEESAARGVGGDQTGSGVIGAGAAYLYARIGASWQLQKYLKASNTGSLDYFGSSVATSADGATIAIGARSESSNALGVGGNQANDNDPVSGAVYLY
jgi:hypothetical protein